MKIRILTSLLFLLLTVPSYSFDRFGKINKGFTYDIKSIEQYGVSRCKIVIEIENNTNSTGSVSFSMVARDIHQNIYWNTSIRSGYVNANDDKIIKKEIYNCNEINPYKIFFRY